MDGSFRGIRNAALSLLRSSVADTSRARHAFRGNRHTAAPPSNSGTAPTGLPHAGSQHYSRATVRPQLHLGDPLQLRSQAGTPHDERAIEVLWRDHKLGYLPRLDNAGAASLLDRAHKLRAEVICIDDPDEE